MAVERKGGAEPAKPTVSIIGAGRLGTALARALAARGYRVEAVVARSHRNARRAAELISAVVERPLALTSKELERLPASDILFITTPDDAIQSVSAELAAALSAQTQKIRGRRGKRTALHASGALSSDVLQSLADAQFATGSMHPLISISDAVQGAKSLSAAFFCVEGSASALRVARRLVRALGAQSFSIKSKDKALYHAAAVMASGHTTALFDIAMEMLRACGLEPRRARRVLLPLLKSTLENLDANDPARALTGTFARADLATVRLHLSALSAPEMSWALTAYRLLGLRSLQLAESSVASSASLKEIARALGKDERKVK